MEHFYIVLTSKHLNMLSNMIRTEFDISHDDDDDYQDGLIDLAAALELYELAHEMQKDLKYK